MCHGPTTICVDYINRRLGKVNAKNLRRLFVTRQAFTAEDNELLASIYSNEELSKHMAMKDHILQVPMEIQVQVKEGQGSELHSARETLEESHLFDWQRFVQVFFATNQQEPSQTNVEPTAYDSRIVKTCDHHHYLCVPKPLEIQHICWGSVISIDPGNRTFATGYDPQRGISGR